MKKYVQTVLRPYSGRLFVTADIETFERLHKSIFMEKFTLEKDDVGRTVQALNKKGRQRYLVYAASITDLVHELVHVMTHMFDRLGIPMSNENTETMAYFFDAIYKDSARVFSMKETSCSEFPKNNSTAGKPIADAILLSSATPVCQK
jgi:hypothetical protein